MNRDERHKGPRSYTEWFENDQESCLAYALSIALKALYAYDTLTPEERKFMKTTSEFIGGDEYADPKDRRAATLGYLLREYAENLGFTLVRDEETDE